MAQAYAFLASLEHHWQLGGRTLRVASLDQDGRGGRIVLSTPVGLRRTARTTLTAVHEPHQVGGVARVGRKTRAYVHWTIEPAATGARVALESRVWSVGALDRALLAVGGRWWLRRAFRETLERLVRALDAKHGPHLVPNPL